MYSMVCNIKNLCEFVKIDGPSVPDEFSLSFLTAGEYFEAKYKVMSHTCLYDSHGNYKSGYSFYKLNRRSVPKKYRKRIKKSVYTQNTLSAMVGGFAQPRVVI